MIIALTGHAGAGKDTAAGILRQHLIARHIDNSGSLEHLARQLDAARAQVLA